ncbi:hypothetical protein BHE74_00000117 [Ensete ventricosum]|nr:hypothetical protein BHE74_00000117 [Ensete ventricosum]
MQVLPSYPNLANTPSSVSLNPWRKNTALPTYAGAPRRRFSGRRALPDRLDAQAYKIIESYSGDAQTWARFIEAKKVADAQRTAAYQEWMRIHRAKRR